MAGLIVIDFIDMEQSGHVRKVEKAMKEALKNDRARIQVGRISSFGLMEMSRQRLRTGVLEASTKPCPHCEGTGLMRTAASAGLSALRIIEDEAARGRGERILLRAGREAAIYVLNKKRSELADIELRYGVSIEIVIDEGFEGARMSVESSGPRPTAAPRVEAPIIDEEEEAAEAEIEEEEEEAEGETRQAQGEGERQGRRRRRRRRGGRGRGHREEQPAADSEEAAPAEQAKSEESAEEAAAEPAKRRRRRGRKGAGAKPEESAVAPDSSPMVERPVDEEPPITETDVAEEPKPAKRRRSKKAAAEAKVTVPEPAPADAPPAETADEAAAPAKTPARKRRSKTKQEPEQAESPEPALVEAEHEHAQPPAANNDIADDSSGEPRRGWWQRTFG
jgi:ribonuclease E